MRTEIKLMLLLVILGALLGCFGEHAAGFACVGAALAVTRAHLDTGASLAWICAVVGSLLLLEYGLLEPIKRALERWREAGA